MKNTGVSGLKPAVNNEQRRKGKGQAFSSVPKVKGQTDAKSSTSLEASLATRANIPCLWEEQDVKDRHVIFYILPCVVMTCLEPGASMAIIACIDMLTQQEVEEREYSKVQGCASQNPDPKKSILRKAGQTRLNASAGHTIQFSGRT